MKNTIYEAKRLIGRKFNDEKCVEDRKFWAFDVVEAEGRNQRPEI